MEFGRQRPGSKPAIAVENGSSLEFSNVSGVVLDEKQGLLDREIVRARD